MSSSVSNAEIYKARAKGNTVTVNTYIGSDKVNTTVSKANKANQAQKGGR